MRRTLIINGKFYSDSITAVHRVAVELLLQLDRHDQELAALFPDGVWIEGPRNARLYPDLPAPRFETRFRSALTGPGWEQLELPWRARHGLLLNLCNLGPVTHARSITMLHDAQIFSTPESYSLKERSWGRLIHPLLGRTNLQMLTVSDFSRSELDRYRIAPASKVSRVYNGADHVLRALPDPSAIARLGIAPGRYVVALANTAHRKNTGVLLRAFAQPALQKLQLVLFGGAGRDRLEAAWGALPPNVVLSGWLNDGELAALIGEASCLAMPSTMEGFGLPPLEAMALGCPALVADCAALPEVCGDAALRLPPHDDAAWAEAILRVTEDQALRAQLKAAGLARSERFTWQAAGDALLNVLRRFAVPVPVVGGEVPA